MTAKINLRTGKIIGADKGSFAWYHEKGHLVYDDSDEGIRDGVRQNFAMYASFLFLALASFSIVFQILSLVSVAAIFYYFIKEEFWCNNYANKKLQEIKK